MATRATLESCRVTKSENASDDVIVFVKNLTASVGKIGAGGGAMVAKFVRSSMATWLTFPSLSLASRTASAPPGSVHREMAQDFFVR